MPCSDGNDPWDAAREAEEKVRTLQGMLCDALTQLVNEYQDIPKSCRSWWAQHEVAEAERVREEALAKLTPRECEALGLGRKK